MRVKASVLGHFGEGANLLNGQTIKTKIITEELQEQLGQDQVLKIDTYGGWKTLLKAPFQVFYALNKSMNVLIFPAQNGLRIYAPLLLFQRCLFKKRKIHYVVIGGWLAEYLRKHRFIAALLKKFDNIYVETSTMKKALEEMAFKNIVVMPNCKELKILRPEELKFNTSEPYKLCTFSRVMKEKGIEDAVDAVKAINENSIICTLDIYGQIDCAYEKEFSKLSKCFPDYVTYKGVTEYSKSTETLKEYYALLFPTYYAGEGFAGTIIDAFASGIPVIATDWKYNAEIVKNLETGLIYPSSEFPNLADSIRWLITHPKKVNEIKYNCLLHAEEFLPKNTLQILVKELR